jgi:hypothetical protein
MTHVCSRLVRERQCAMLVVSVCCAVLAVVLSSCSAELTVQREWQRTDDSVSTIRYSIVCVIHGDGDYVYHDTSGNEHIADEEALAEAQRIGLNNPLAEVFVFHQRSRRHILFLFSHRDGDFYYYRNGRLIDHELYWRDQKQSRLEPESRLYRRFHTGNDRAMVRTFVYCGHEIPEFGGAGYDASYPDRMFTVQDFADGLRGFTHDSTKFDLLILSTCFGGTPYTIGALGHFARTIIASPENLHLSYFDFHSLERLEVSSMDEDVPAFAVQFAHQSFDRLAANVQTAVSVAVYDGERVQGFLQSVRGTYDRTLTTVSGEMASSSGTVDHCDCADIPGYAMTGIHEGVTLFYRPARFGRTATKQSHSGWECLKARTPQQTFSQARDHVVQE